MAQRCRYTTPDEPHCERWATHAAQGVGWPPYWAPYDAMTRGSTCVPEFCLEHAMVVAEERNSAAWQAEEERLCRS